MKYDLDLAKFEVRGARKRAGQSHAPNLSNEAFDSISSLKHVTLGSLGKSQGLVAWPAAAKVV